MNIRESTLTDKQWFLFFWANQGVKIRWCYSQTYKSRVSLHIAGIGAYFLLTDKVSLKFSILKWLCKRRQGNNEVKIVTMTVIFCLTFRNLDVSIIYVLSLVNPICEMYLSFRTEWPRYHNPFIYRNFLPVIC